MRYERKIPIDLECGVTIYDIMAGGKWKPYIINCMNRGVRRPSEFQRVIPGQLSGFSSSSSMKWNGWDLCQKKCLPKFQSVWNIL